ncbi:MAG TPA: Na+/H+ antiporter [Acidimicrobiales bacterium]|nr:Na+/H+ antiporter [Acidimicrobiales bacterium]
MTGSVLAAGLAIAVVVVASRALSQRSGIPYPVFLVVAGAAASFIPHLPAVHLQPRVVFLGFLPPLVYHAGLVTSPRELRANAAPIGLGALGLVLATTFAVAGATWAAVPSLGWAAAFILGSVVAPTDPVAATSVLNRLGAPPEVTAILEGESLVNDGIALALFSLGVAALATPTSIGGGLLAFLKVAGGGAAFGLGLGWVVSRIRRPLRDSASQIVVSLLVPFVAYLPADALGLSGVLATLTTGLVIGQQTVAGLAPAGRLRVAEFWEVLVFLLESVLFVLVGVQLRYIISGLAGYPPADIAVVTALTVTVVPLVRMGWWLVVPTLRWRPEGRILDTGAVPWQERVALGWSGLRGAISLAAALSVPTAVAGSPLAARDLIIFATFCVIAVTLLGQGTSLPWLLRRLSLVGGDTERRQHALADRRCAEAALRKLDEIASSDGVSDVIAETLRQVYERRLDRVRTQLGGGGGDDRGGPSLGSVQRRLLATQHEVLRQLHRDGEISFTVMREVRRELDLEHASLEP